METLLKNSCAIIKRAGNALKNSQLPVTRAWNKQEMILQFRAANAVSGNLIREGLLTIAPHIPWPDAEFDVAQQKDTSPGGTYWVCDPIGGAMHFLQGFSPWCISLALVKEEVVMFSVVYDPVRDEMFTALRKRGAWLNGEKIRVNVRSTMQDAVLATAHPDQPSKEQKDTTLMLTSLGRLLPQVGAVRILGPSSLQLAYVAAGRLDGFWEYGQSTYNWLAGALLVEEAGGKVQTIGGEDFPMSGIGGIVAANESLVTLIDEQLPVEWDIFTCRM